MGIRNFPKVFTRQRRSWESKFASTIFAYYKSVFHYPNDYTFCVLKPMILGATPQSLNAALLLSIMIHSLSVLLCYILILRKLVKIILQSKLEE